MGNCELLTTNVTIQNEIPDIVDILGGPRIELVQTTIREGEHPRIKGTFTDKSLDDTHEVFVEWPGDDGANGFIEVVNVQYDTINILELNGSFQTDPSVHDLYQDDHPSNTPEDVYTIRVHVVTTIRASRCKSWN